MSLNRRELFGLFAAAPLLASKALWVKPLRLASMEFSPILLDTTDELIEHAKSRSWDEAFLAEYEFYRGTEWEK